MTRRELHALIEFLRREPDAVIGSSRENWTHAKIADALLRLIFEADGQ